MFVVGQKVSYVLKPEDLPTDPNREYQGIILAIHGSQIQVHITDPAYDGDEEWIEASQVRFSESKMESKTVRFSWISLDMIGQTQVYKRAYQAEGRGATPNNSLSLSLSK
jgi:hypothetical protein